MDKFNYSVSDMNSISERCDPPCPLCGWEEETFEYGCPNCIDAEPRHNWDRLVAMKQEIDRLRGELAEWEAAYPGLRTSSGDIQGVSYWQKRAERAEAMESILRAVVEEIIEKESQEWDTRDGNPPPDVQDCIDTLRNALEGE